MPGTITPSLVHPAEQERMNLDQHLAREREWYKDSPRFQTLDDVQDAVSNGVLVTLEPDENIRLVGRFFSSEFVGHQPHATPRAAVMARELGVLWRKQLESEYGIVDPSLYLSLTSATRFQRYQDQIVAEGKLASPDSTHCTGNALDFDVSALYQLIDGKFVSISDARRHKGQRMIQEHIRRQAGGQGVQTEIGQGYDERYTHAAILAARLMHQSGEINLIEEFSGTENACLHMAVNPEAHETL